MVATPGFFAAQVERKNLQEKLGSCTNDLEYERKELAKLRQEEIERERQHKTSIDEFRSEINRLHHDLREAGYTSIKLVFSYNFNRICW